MTMRTPTIKDITTDRVQEIGHVIRNLSVGDAVKVTNSHMNGYLTGDVVSKTNSPNGEEYFAAIINLDRNEKNAELHANWRDIPEGDDDQETPYTGLIIAPFNDTAPPVTDIKVL